jgi:GTP-binding nuclear protein Ran
LKTGEFNKPYIGTLGYNPSDLEFETNRGTVKFHIYDFSGKDSYQSLVEDIYSKIDGLLVFYDPNDPESASRSDKLFQKFRSLKSVPTVICANKCDLLQESVHEKPEGFSEYQFYEVSAFTNYNIEKPFLFLSRALMSDQELEFIPGKAKEPPVAVVDKDLLTINKKIRELEGELALYKSIRSRLTQ